MGEEEEEQEGEKNNNDILSKSESEEENKVDDKASIKESINNNVGKVNCGTKVENIGSEKSEGINSGKTREEARLATTNQEKPIKDEQLEASITSGINGT